MGPPHTPVFWCPKQLGNLGGNCFGKIFKRNLREVGFKNRPLHPNPQNGFRVWGRVL